MYTCNVRAPCVITSCSQSCIGACDGYGCNNSCSTCLSVLNFNPSWTCVNSGCHSNCGTLCWSSNSSMLSRDGRCSGCSGIYSIYSFTFIL